MSGTISFDGVEVPLPDGENFTVERVKSVIEATFRVTNIDVREDENGNFIGTRVAGEKA